MCLFVCLVVCLLFVCLVGWVVICLFACLFVCLLLLVSMCVLLFVGLFLCVHCSLTAIPELRVLVVVKDGASECTQIVLGGRSAGRGSRRRGSPPFLEFGHREARGASMRYLAPVAPRILSDLEFVSCNRSLIDICLISD